LHELRVHVFRRDQYYKKANTTSDMNEKKEFYFTSFKEDLILRKYYKRSIENSVYWRDKDKIKKFEALINKNRSYRSPVSSNLFTAFSEKTCGLQF
jgi:predicted transcriptional regulator